MALLGGDVEPFTLTFASGDTTKTYNLTNGQDAGKVIPIISCEHDGNTDAFAQLGFDVDVLSGPARVVVTRTTSGSTCTIKGFALEFGSDITVQKKNYTWSTGTTLNTSVTTLGATSDAWVVNYCRFTGTRSDDWDEHMVRVRVTSTTNVEQTVDTFINGHTGTFYVAEDTTAGNDHWTVQHHDFTSSGTGTSGTSTVTSTTMGKTFIIASFNTDNPFDNSDDEPTIALTAATTLTWARYVGGNNTYNWTVMLVELQGADASVQRGSIDLTTTNEQADDTFATAIDQTVASVNLLKSCGLPQMGRLSSVGSDGSGSMASGEFLDDDTVRIRMDGAVNASRHCEYEIVEWQAAAANAPRYPGLAVAHF